MQSSFFTPPSTVVKDGWLETSFVQMGQPADLTAQRQQSDNLPRYQDAHGVERELQFTDLGARQIQAIG